MIDSNEEYEPKSVRSNKTTQNKNQMSDSDEPTDTEFSSNTLPEVLISLFN